TGDIGDEDLVTGPQRLDGGAGGLDDNVRGVARARDVAAGDGAREVRRLGRVRLIHEGDVAAVGAGAGRSPAPQVRRQRYAAGERSVVAHQDVGLTLRVIQVDVVSTVLIGGQGAGEQIVRVVGVRDVTTVGADLRAGSLDGALAGLCHLVLRVVS